MVLEWLMNTLPNNSTLNQCQFDVDIHQYIENKTSTNFYVFSIMMFWCNFSMQFRWLKSLRRFGFHSWCNFDERKLPSFRPFLSNVISMGKTSTLFQRNFDQRNFNAIFEGQKIDLISIHFFNAILMGRESMQLRRAYFNLILISLFGKFPRYQKMKVV